MKNFPVLLLAMACFWSCTSDTIEPFPEEGGCDELDVSLASDIAPIIEQNCAISGCHLDRRSPILDSNDAIRQHASRIRARTTAGTMPPSGALQPSLVSQINCWVENGAQDN